MSRKAKAGAGDAGLQGFLFDDSNPLTASSQPVQAKRRNFRTHVGSMPHEERGLDFHETPAGVTLALLAEEELPRWLWESMTGNGAMVRPLRDAGHAVIASDIVERNFKLHFTADFLKLTKAPEGTEAIITNPAFKIATAFMRHALTLCPRVYMFGKLQILQAEERTPILRDALRRVLIFENRINGLHRDGWTGNRVRQAQSFAWFVLERGYRGPRDMEWIRYVPAPGDGGRP